MDLTQLDLATCRTLLDSGEVTSQQLCQAYLDRASSQDGEIGAFVDLDKESILKAAALADEALAKKSNNDQPLLGVPIALKDNINFIGRPTSCASHILEGYVSPYNAGATEGLLNSGAVIFGKTNLDEFAMGGSNENSAIKPVKNPWDKQKVPGGSSGGSAAAVAGCMVPGALGSDTGGSIRQPAAFCGVYGLKPTYGRVSRYGLVAFGSSLDQIGPIGKTPSDLATMLQAIAGYDKRDATSKDVPTEDYSALVQAQPAVKTVAYVEYEQGVQPEILDAYQKVLDYFKNERKYKLKKVSLPHAEYGIPVYYILATSEASTNLARFDGVRYGNRASGAADLQDLYLRSRSGGFGTEVKRRILLGTFALSSGYYDAYYKKASQVRTLIQSDYQAVFKEADILITPTTPTTAFGIGENINDPLKMYLGDLMTVGANLAGIPGLNVPFGFADGLPIGIQILGNYFEESKLLQTANAIHNDTPLGEVTRGVPAL